MKIKLLLTLLLLSSCASNSPLEQESDSAFSVNPIFEGEEINKTSVLRNPSKSLPKMPTVEYEKEPLTDFKIKQSLKIPIRKLRYAVLPDGKYTRIKFDSFIKFNNWFKDSTKQLWPKNLGEAYDCDNFAFLYKSLLSVTSYTNNNTCEVAVGVIYVRQEYEFGGVPVEGNTYHALNIIYTGAGWFVFEPQTGYYDRLEHYKNEILWYIF